MCFAIKNQYPDFILHVQINDIRNRRVINLKTIDIFIFSALKP